jgi:hypothetical protein
VTDEAGNPLDRDTADAPRLAGALRRGLAVSSMLSGANSWRCALTDGLLEDLSRFASLGPVLSASPQVRAVNRPAAMLAAAVGGAVWSPVFLTGAVFLASAV